MSDDVGDFFLKLMRVDLKKNTTTKTHNFNTLTLIVVNGVKYILE